MERGLQVLLLGALLCSAGCQAEERRSGVADSPLRSEPASAPEQNKDLTPKIEHLRNGVPVGSAGSGRLIIFITKGRQQVEIRSSGKTPRSTVTERAVESWVITDGSAQAFVDEWKQRRHMPGGSVQSVSVQTFEEVLKDLDALGLTEVKLTPGIPGAETGDAFGIHIDAGGRRRSYMKSDATGKAGPCYGRCTHYIAFVLDEKMTREQRLEKARARFPGS